MGKSFAFQHFQRVICHDLPGLRLYQKFATIEVLDSNGGVILCWLTHTQTKRCVTYLNSKPHNASWSDSVLRISRSTFLRWNTLCFFAFRTTTMILWAQVKPMPFRCENRRWIVLSQVTDISRQEPGCHISLLSKSNLVIILHALDEEG